MRKYAVMVLAVMLVGVLVSGAWALLNLISEVYQEQCYVGGEERSLASVRVYDPRAYQYDTYTFSYNGDMPPGCELKDLGIGAAEIYGVPTTKGLYIITIYVQARGTFLGERYANNGSTTLTVGIADIGNNDSPDIPATAPDPSKDIPAPVPNPKPEAVGIIANKLGLSSADVEYVASSDMKAVQPPTASITNALSSDGQEIISTQGSITAQKTGYYVFPLTVPADLVGTNTELKVYLSEVPADGLELSGTLDDSNYDLHDEYLRPFAGLRYVNRHRR